MSSELSEKDKQFEQFKANFFKCITNILQLLVEEINIMEFEKMEGELIDVWGAIKFHRLFMDLQRPMINTGDISKMNIATCNTIIKFVCGLEPLDKEFPEKTGYSEHSLERPFRAILCQLMDIAYSKEYFDNTQQNEHWDKLIETINEMYCIVVSYFQNIDLENKLSELLQQWSVRKEITAEKDLSEYMMALDFMVRGEFFEVREKHKPSFLYFCPSKIFSKFKIRHSNADELILYTDIFDWKGEHGKFPQIYVICGPLGAGKSFYMNYVYQQFGTDSSFIGIDRFDFIFFIESSNNSAHSLNEYINSAFPKTIHKLKLNIFQIQEIMLRGKLLIMMDSFDFATPETHQLLNEITTISSDISLMIATRSDFLEDLCKELPKNKTSLILYPESNVTASEDNESQRQMVENKDDTASCTASLEIPSGYETSSVSKVLMDENQLNEWKSNAEFVTINDNNPNDKKKPSTGTVKNAARRLKDLIECLCTVTAQLSNYKSDKEKCQLKDILDEYEDLHKEANALHKKMPSGVCKDLYDSGKSLFWGIRYWFLRLSISGDLDISNEILNEMENNYSEVKNHLQPKPKKDISPVREKPNSELVVASVGILGDLVRQAQEAVKMIERNEGITDQETKNCLRELVIDIRNLRERCDMFNASLSKIIMFNYLVEKKHLGLFAGLDYFYTDVTLKYHDGKAYRIKQTLVKQLDEADTKIRNHLFNPEPIQPTLVKSWKTEEISTITKKNKVKKTKPKKKSKTGW